MLCHKQQLQRANKTRVHHIQISLVIGSCCLAIMPFGILLIQRQTELPKMTTTFTAFFFFSPTNQITKWRRSSTLSEELQLPLSRRKESIEVKWKSIKLLVPVVSSERSELHPPRHTPVLFRLLHVQSVVQKYTNNKSHSRWRHKYGIQECIKLQEQEELLRKFQQVLAIILVH